jgi:hypothetical protein
MELLSQRQNATIFTVHSMHDADPFTDCIRVVGEHSRRWMSMRIEDDVGGTA